MQKYSTFLRKEDFFKTEKTFVIEQNLGFAIWGSFKEEYKIPCHPEFFDKTIWMPIKHSLKEQVVMYLDPDRIHFNLIFNNAVFSTEEEQNLPESKKRIESILFLALKAINDAVLRINSDEIASTFKSSGNSLVLEGKYPLHPDCFKSKYWSLLKGFIKNQDDIQIVLDFKDDCFTVNATNHRKLNGSNKPIISEQELIDKIMPELKKQLKQSLADWTVACIECDKKNYRPPENLFQQKAP